jgi:outer membrane protein assembly factor BamD
MHRTSFSALGRAALPALALVALAACSRGFQVSRYQGQNEELYRVSLGQYQRGNWDHAVAGFERLTLDLPARDTLLPRSFFYLGRSHARRKEWVLAAQTFNRLAETFPTDTLADDALWEAGRSYERLWRKPVLDPANGAQAQTAFRTLVALYPESPLRAQAEAEVAKINQWMATKDYENGLHYMRRKAFDSAIIYFKDVIRNYPDTPRVRDAYLALVRAYRAIRYTEDANEACSALRTAYPGDAEVRETCGAAPAQPAAVPAP